MECHPTSPSTRGRSTDRAGAELVATHDLGADPDGEVTLEVVVDATRSAGPGAARPARRVESPGHQLGRVGVAEGPLEGLLLAGPIAVLGDGETLNSDPLRHTHSLYGRLVANCNQSARL